MNKNIIWLAGIVVLVGALFFLTNQKEDSVQVSDNIKEIVSDLSLRKVEANSASINGKNLVVTDTNDEEITYKLPEDEFFVSIAPYINSTHP